MTAKRVLVTGASGFIGRPLVRALVDAGYAVRAATRRPVPFPEGVEVAIAPDLSGPVDWDPIVRGIDIVIHAAAHVHLAGSKDQHDLGNRINFMATYDLAQAAARAGIERFLFLSSVRAQCGASNATAVRESDDMRPTNNYGRSKAAAELSVWAAGVPFTILRPVVVYGPNPKASIKLIVRLASLPVPLPIKNLSSRRSLLGIDNLISAIFFVLNNPTTIGETYLVADPKPLTISELFVMLRELQGRRPLTFGVPSTFYQTLFKLTRKTHLWDRLSGNLIVETAKLESAGWRAPVDTYDGLRTMISIENDEGPSKVEKSHQS